MTLPYFLPVISGKYRISPTFVSLVFGVAAIVGADINTYGGLCHPLFPVMFAGVYLLLVFILNHLHGSDRGDRVMLSCIIIATGIGVAALLRIDPTLASKQLLWITLGSGLFSIASAVPIETFIRSRPDLIAGVAVSLLLMTIFFGDDIRGARGWLTIGFQFQPIEMVKPLFIAALATYLTRVSPGGHKFLQRDKGKAVLLTLAIPFLLTVQNDIGAAFLLLSVAIILLLIVIRHLAFTLPALFGTIGAGVWAITQFPHVTSRITAWIDPWSDPDGAGYQLIHAAFAFGAGGLFGTGWGAGHSSDLPVVYSDMIIALIGEEIGMMGALSVLFLLAVLCFRCIRPVLIRQVHPSVKMAIIGMALLLCLQTAAIIGGSTGLLPLTGVTLPFVSYGGSSMLASFGMVGFVWSYTVGRKTTTHVRIARVDDDPIIRTIKPVVRLMVVILVVVGLSIFFRAAVDGTQLFHHHKNPRLYAAMARYGKGGIYDRYGEPLSVSLLHDDGYKRVSFAPVSLMHMIGYATSHYGVTGLESRFNREMLGARLDLVLTIDTCLQSLTERLMTGQQGAVIAIHPTSGEILVSASIPGLSHNELDDDALADRSNGAAPLFNRVTHGQYVPGSAFKPVVMAAALEMGVAGPMKVYEDTGRAIIGDRQIRNYQSTAHGLIGFDEAFSFSSNAVFAQLATTLPADAFRRFLVKSGFGIAPRFDLITGAGRLPSPEQFHVAEHRAEIGIGHGHILVTPMQMAMFVAAIANQGTGVNPTIVRSLTHPGDTAIVNEMQEVTSRKSSNMQIMSPGTAQVVKNAMVRVVERGTGTSAQIDGVRVAGKTGTAEIDGNLAHAWFLGFAPADDPQIAVAVVVEHAGFGGTVAAPIARELMAAYLSRYSLIPGEDAFSCPTL